MRDSPNFMGKWLKLATCVGVKASTCVGKNKNIPLKYSDAFNLFVLSKESFGLNNEIYVGINYDEINSIKNIFY